LNIPCTMKIAEHESENPRKGFIIVVERWQPVNHNPRRGFINRKRAQSARHPLPLTAGYTVIPMKSRKSRSASLSGRFGTAEESL